MRKFVTVLLCVISISAFSQDIRQIVKTFKVPGGWSGELMRDTSYVSMFGKKLVAVWRFECKKKKLQPVEFLIFNYVPQDSASMSQKALIYYATSNCLVASNQDIRQNSMNFSKGSYYFVEKMCPCYTTGSEECGTMVRQMQDWIGGKDKSKEY
jgi:hypothetical protein